MPRESRRELDEPRKNGAEEKMYGVWCTMGDLRARSDVDLRQEQAKQWTYSPRSSGHPAARGEARWSDSQTLRLTDHQKGHS
ncbi:hypothetical protein F503_08597 [Ophiostoma piceae UAMH 11346]|uniref:Uncharacterized protein n=1 Tax=Ophiostoma piceae (strain UAMH 11346) TaxID=1262450 RepID=S3CNY6_OPHP1|nr:hypothetical protein F503_08597 [Ophiostoma piceae UAMH 11346]